MDTCSRKYTGPHMDNSSFGIRVGGNYMKYEEPIMEVNKYDVSDLIRTSLGDGDGDNTMPYTWAKP